MLRVTTELDNKEKLIKESELTFLHFIKSKIEKTDNLLSLYSLYRFFFKREKLIYTTLNKCVRSDNFLIGEVWIPEEKFEMIQNQQFLHASIYVMISVIIGCVAVYFGGYCARFL